MWPVFANPSSRDVKNLCFKRVERALEEMRTALLKGDLGVGPLEIWMAPPRNNVDIYEHERYRAYAQQMLSAYPVALLISLSNDFFAFYTLACLRDVLVVRNSLNFMPERTICHRADMVAFLEEQRAIIVSAAPNFGILPDAVEVRLGHLRDYLGLSESSGGRLGTGESTPFFVRP